MSWIRNKAVIAVAAVVVLAGLVTGVLLAVRGGGQANPVSATPSPAARGTTFTTASGQRMTFTPGQVWVVLAYR
jgi:hypothetical protein